MKVSPINPTGATVGVTGDSGSIAQRIRTMKMSTNATPGREDPITDPNVSIPTTSSTATVEATQPLSPQLAAIAKQRRALQVKERELADREKALSSPGTQPTGIDATRLKSDPLGVLLEQGVTYEQLTQAVLASQEAAPMRALEDKIKALEQGFDQKLSDQATQQKQQALTEMRREALQLVAQGEDFELVRETKNVPQVMALIERTYDETGEVLDVREALKLVEDELIKDSLKLAGMQKIRSQIVPPTPPQPQRHTRTLTNRDTASVPLSPKARALAAFNGTLKR